MLKLDFLKNFLISSQLKSFCIAYSGGLDSHVLLHAVNALKNDLPEFKFQAIHINHQLSPNALKWESHCKKICEDLNFSYESIAVNANHIKGQSKEAAARDARYKVFAELLDETKGLLTAHHQDDQAETLLLQLMRGAGPKGLSAMPSSKPFGKGIHLRPLLNMTRADLKDYATKNQLNWIEDESNLNVNFERNFIRHEVLPLLQRRKSSIAKTLTRVAKNCQDTELLLEEIAQEDLQRIQINNVNQNTLYIPALLELSKPRRQTVLRYWLQQQNLNLPSRTKLESLEKEVLLSKPDRNPYLHWLGVEIRRFKNFLYAMPTTPNFDANEVIPWDIYKNPSLKLPNHTTLQARAVRGEGIKINKSDRIHIRFRQGGELFRPKNRQHSHPLKKLLQEWEVPPWLRNQIPLVFKNDKLIQIVNFATNHDYSAGPEESGWHIVVLNRCPTSVDS